MKSKTLIMIAIILLVLILLGTGVYFLVSKDEKNTKTEDKTKMYYSKETDTYYDGDGNYYKGTDKEGVYYSEEEDVYFQIMK